MKPRRLWLATASLIVAGLVYLALGAGSLAFVQWLAHHEPTGADTTIIFYGMGGLCAVLGVACAALAVPLHRGRKWAFYVSLGVFGIFVPSAFLPMGALGLWGILDRESREYFGALLEL